jgi:S-adenosylmethionine:tRNA-ribosyltransferase-isomerase (queuine synthetase)
MPFCTEIYIQWNSNILRKIVKGRTTSYFLMQHCCATSFYSVRTENMMQHYLFVEWTMITHLFYRETVRCRGLTIVADIRGSTASTINTLLESLYLFEVTHHYIFLKLIDENNWPISVIINSGQPEHSH